MAYHPTRRTHHLPIGGIVCSGIACLVFALGLFAGAFVITPGSFVTTPEANIEAEDPCATSSTFAESVQTVLMFTLGYAFCLAAKNRHDLAMQTKKMFRVVTDAMSSACSAVSTSVSAVTKFRQRITALQQTTWFSTQVISIVFVVALCVGCIACLIGSAFAAAFAADPNADPTVADDGVTSDMSTSMRVFTVGWILIFSFKLQRELVEQVGASCLFQPW
jgi:hypothetical protein